jgi:hypothetical protein
MRHSLTKSTPHLNDVAADRWCALRLPDGRRNQTRLKKALPPGLKEQKGCTPSRQKRSKAMARK